MRILPPPIGVETKSPCADEHGKHRIEWLDTLRLLACFLVILTHSSLPADSPSQGVYLAVISLIGSPASELFLSLSGAVLLPVKTGFKRFYKRRFAKLLIPLCFWSVIIVISYVLLGKLECSDGVNRLIRLPLYPVVGVYWFMYVMIGLYLFAPFISFWLREATRRQVELFLGLWIVNMLLPYLNLVSPGLFTATNGDHYWMLNLFAGFLGYWILGYYLRRYPIKIGMNPYWIAVVAGTVGYLVVLLYVRYKGIDALPYYDNLQIGSACLVVLLYTVIQSYPVRNESVVNIITSIAKYSFGIYLIHILVVRELVWRVAVQMNLHPVVSTVVISMISFLICWSVVHLFSMFTVGRKLVGL